MSQLLLMGDSGINPRSLFANNEPGVWYDPAGNDGASESKRAWRRNLLLWSDQYSNATWGKEAVTVTANSTVAPDGTTTADTITEDGTTARHRLSQNFSHSAGVTYTYSVEAKLGTGTRFLIINANTAIGGMASFNLSTGAVHSTTSGVAAIASLGNGWYRCSVTGTATTSGTTVTYIQLDNDGVDGTYAGDSSSSLILGGSQIEIGSLTAYQRITDFSSDFLSAYQTHSLYQDSTGVTPAVYPGDPVGLFIGQARGGLGSLGVNLPAFANFNFTSGWGGIGTGSVTNANTFSTSGAGGINNSANPLESGKHFLIEVSITPTTAVTFNVRLSNSGSLGTELPSITMTAGVANTYRVVGLTAAGSLQIYLRVGGAGSFTVNSISIREIPGTHRYQTDNTARPLLCRVPEGGRRNLLTYSEQFDNAAWTKSLLSVTANADSAPDATITADRLVNAASASSDLIYQDVTVSTGATVAYSFYAKQGTVGRWLELAVLNTAYTNGVIAWFDLQNGVAGTASNTGTGTGVTAAIQSVGNGWYRCSVSGAIPSTTTYRCLAVLVNGDNSTTRLNNANALIWGAQLETGSTATAYQRVTLTTDVTETGKRDCWGLLYDGTNDSHLTPSVDFSGTDKMTVWAGVRKLSDAAVGVFVELSADSGSNNGAFGLFAPSSGGAANYMYRSFGNVAANNAVTTYTSPITNVLSCSSAIASDLNVVRVNGTLAASISSDQGSGNYGNYPLYFGRRNNATLPFNGIEFGTIIRGAATTDAQIRAIEKWMAQRAGITI